MCENRIQVEPAEFEVNGQQSTYNKLNYYRLCLKAEAWKPELLKHS